MPWGAIAEISQIVSAFALVISLIYIGFQIRFARLAAADTSRTARGEGVREIDLAMVNNRELRENWIKSSNLKSIYEELGSELDLGVDATLQVDTICQVWMRLHWGQFQSITVPEDLNDLERLVTAFYSAPPMLNCWKKSPYGRKIYDPKFVKFIEDAILKTSS